MERRIIALHTSNDVGRRLATIPGIGPMTASAIAAAVPHGAPFCADRQFAAWLGLTPRAHGSGGRDRRTGIGKQARAICVDFSRRRHGGPETRQEGGRAAFPGGGPISSGASPRS